MITRSYLVDWKKYMISSRWRLRIDSSVAASGVISISFRDKLFREIPKLAI
jgi:hypothetical protein